MPSEERITSDLVPHNEAHHKYQTIQSFRPEEVKELLSQHFLDPNSANGRTSAPNEEGIRRFSLVRTNFKQRRAFRNSKDAATLKGEEQEGMRISSSSNGSTADHSGFMEPDEAHTSRTSLHSDDGDAEHDSSVHEIAKLRAQLAQERAIHSREMSRMRAQLRAFEGHLAHTVLRMGSLLETIDARERAVQELLTKNSKTDDESDWHEREETRTAEKEKGDREKPKVDLPLPSAT